MIPKIHHICIQTNAYEASKAFYCELLGFEIELETPNFHGRSFNTWLKLGNFRIELQTPKNQEIFAPYDGEAAGITHFCLLVEDVKAVYGHLVEKGCQNFKLKNGQALYSVENSLLLKVIAPEGTIIEFRDMDAL